MEYRIEDLIDVPLFQVLQDKLNEIYSFPAAIIDNDGKVLTATAWQDICTKFHRTHPVCAEECRKSDLYILEHLGEAKPAVTYRCPHGLVDNATPIVIGGKHVASYFTGQFFLEPPDLEFFRRQAKRYGFDEEAYLAAVAKVPVWSLQKLAHYLDFIKGFTEILCGIGLKHLHELETRRELAENASALEEMSTFNQRIIESVEEGIVVYGPDLRYRVWNPFMERLTGLSANDALGKHPLDVFPFLEQEGVIDRVLGALRGTASPPVDFAYQMPDGSKGWVSDTCAPLFARNGTITGVISVVRDITASKRAEEDQQRLRAQLAQAQRLESVGRLAGGIAHDFNNMLSVIFGHVDLALEELDEDSAVRGDLLEVRRAAERSANLTRQLLAFARRQPVAPKVLDLNANVASFLRLLRRLVGENIELQWNPSPDPIFISIDPSQLDQTLTNLCVNARDAITGAGTVMLETRSVALDAAGAALHPGLAPGRYAILSVSDTGTGMTKEIQDQIFEPFFSTKTTGQGTGLGLATVYGIVTQNGGTIEASSEPGRGTTFRVHFPQQATPAAYEPQSERAATQAVTRGSETLLLVEDDGAVRRTTSRLLDSLGYKVIEAATPSQALRLATELGGAIDLLVSDVVMPEMDGVELARRLCSMQPHLKRLFISGYPAPLTSPDGTLPGDVMFLAKPFSSGQLAEKVRAALGGEP